METKEASVDGIRSRDFVERVRLNQPRLSSEMKSQYDFIICGSGSSSGSVVAGQPAENPQVSVLLIDVGSEDNVPSVNEPGQWFLNLGPNGTGTFGRGRLLRRGRTDPLEMLGAEKQKHVLRGSLRLPDDLVVRRLA
jgi:choline dehydrogenase